MKNILTLFCLLFLTQGALRSQEVKFGKIEKSDLQEGAHQTDSAAVATVLYRNVYLYYRYIQGSGFHQVREVHERIKIHDKDGYEYATVTEALYHADGEKEGIGSLKGNTYNLEGDKVSVDKLKRSDAFREELNDYYDLHKFTMPNVREGSIIEYEYTVQSPFAYSIDEIDMQYDIPIAYQKVRLEIPEFMVFTPRFKGYLLLRPETGKRNGKVNFTYSTSGRYDTGGPNYKNAGVDYEINTHTYEMREVPALDSEAYVNNMDNYRAAVNYELQYVQFPESPRENFNTSWDQVVQRIYQSDRFGHVSDIVVG